MLHFVLKMMISGADRSHRVQPRAHWHDVPTTSSQNSLDFHRFGVCFVTCVFSGAGIRQTLRRTVSKNDELCIKNEELCIKNEELCIENDGFAAALAWQLIYKTGLLSIVQVFALFHSIHLDFHSIHLDCHSILLYVMLIISAIIAGPRKSVRAGARSLRNDGFSIENDGFSIENDGFSIENDGLCYNNDDFCGGQFLQRRLNAEIQDTLTQNLLARYWYCTFTNRSHHIWFSSDLFWPILIYSEGLLTCVCSSDDIFYRMIQASPQPTWLILWTMTFGRPTRAVIHVGFVWQIWAVFADRRSHQWSYAPDVWWRQRLCAVLHTALAGGCRTGRSYDLSDVPARFPCWQRLLGDDVRLLRRTRAHTRHTPHHKDELQRMCLSWQIATGADRCWQIQMLTDSDADRCWQMLTDADRWLVFCIAVRCADPPPPDAGLQSTRREGLRNHIVHTHTHTTSFPEDFKRKPPFFNHR